MSAVLFTLSREMRSSLSFSDVNTFFPVLRPKDRGGVFFTLSVSILRREVEERDKLERQWSDLVLYGLERTW